MCAIVGCVAHANCDPAADIDADRDPHRDVDITPDRNVNRDPYCDINSTPNRNPAANNAAGYCC
jgi:hypothetical protein